MVKDSTALTGHCPISQQPHLS